jgi:hypothetical protein
MEMYFKMVDKINHGIDKDLKEIKTASKEKILFSIIKKWIIDVRKEGWKKEFCSDNLNKLFKKN